MTDLLIRDVPDEVIVALDPVPAAWVCPAASTCDVGSLRTLPPESRSAPGTWRASRVPSET